MLASLVGIIAGIDGPPAMAADPSVVLAERAEVGFQTLSNADGLSNNTVMALAQDRTGFIWIGTLGGLNRFDGYATRTFEHDPHDPGSLPNGFVRALLPASDGGMWLGTHTAGVAYYDPRTDRFKTLGAGPEGLGHVQVYALAPDGRDGVWVATVAGLDHVGRDLTIRERVRTGELGFPEGYVFAIFRDRAGTLWAGTEKAVARRPAGADHWQTLSGADAESALALSTGSWSFFEDPDGRVWIGTNGGGIVSVAPGDDAARSHPRLTGRDTPLGRATVRGIVEERPGVLWISLFGGGVVEYDIGQDRLRLFRADPNVPGALKGNFTRGIMKDRGGVVWVATNMGVAWHNSMPSGVASIALGQTRGFSGRDAWSLWTAPDGGLWLGLDDGGLDRLDLSSGHIVPFGRGVAPGALAGTPVYAIRGAGADDIWVGSAGLARLRPAAGERTPQPFPMPGTQGRDVTALRVGNQHLWIGTYYGLVRQSLSDGQATLFAADPAQPDSLSNNEVWSILPRPDGTVWVGTANGLNLMRPDGGFRRFHRDPDRPDGLPHDYVAALTLDNRGRLWLGTTGGGVALMTREPTDDQPPSFRTVSRQDGLPSNTVASLTPGSDGRIWVSTDNGLAAIDPDDFSVSLLERGASENISSYLPGSATTLPDGGLVFGGTNGITLVQPSRIRSHAYLDALAVTRVVAGGQPANASVLNLPGAPGLVHLPPGNRRLTVEFALLDYAVTGTVRYAYRLDGFDTDWTTPEGESRLAAYTNLPPGRYTLRLRALAPDGQVVAERSVGVAVSYLWHEWGWVRFLGLVVALSAGAGIVMMLERARIDKLSATKRELEAKVEERTASLRDANDRLAELATRDALTGIYNRRAFMERLDHEWSAALRHGQPFCVLMLDLDHFKEVNDTYGHLVGDTVLREVAQRAQGALRETDMLARYGGEEFVVLTSHTDAAHAEIAADRIRVAVGSLPIILDGVVIQVTVSIGVAQAEPHRETQTSLFNRTDNALYAAKAAGRNRVVVG
ncbi:diguanylate cyclase [Niveispirillum sp.]|uniref:ligand-binding sensor domain-containing diguanylate cyclase n=1 Tax=Niveispirillum sp. TaxID=1917217 RepID=UPI001B7C49BD|nr:diguanylate cyclase [Niveispirillum sp.]MBP7335485.1 diguanylate cyclase [Niveispirillum sp.]